MAKKAPAKKKAEQETSNITVRFPDKLYGKIRIRAAIRGVSINQYLVDLAELDTADDAEGIEPVSRIGAFDVLLQDRMKERIEDGRVFDESMRVQILLFTYFNKLFNVLGSTVAMAKYIGVDEDRIWDFADKSGIKKQLSDGFLPGFHPDEAKQKSK